MELVVKKIKKLEHPGVLRDFSWGSDLPSFGRFNLFYGWNGSGKTTISNVFRSLQFKEMPDGKVVLSTASGTFSGEDFPESKLQVRVFNKDFVTKSVFTVDRKVEPIFVLGEESAEKQARIEQKKKIRIEEQNAHKFAQSEKSKSEAALERRCTKQATTVREALRSSGKNTYNNYNRADYKKRADEMCQAGDKSEYLLDDNEHAYLSKQIQALPKQAISKVVLRFPNLKRLTETTRQLLSKTVVTSAIKKIRDDPELSSWIREGLGLHRQREVNQCLFCEQSLPDGRVAALEAHFNTEYEQLLNRLEAHIKTLKAESELISQAPLPKKAYFYEALVPEFEQHEQKLKDDISAIVDYFSTLKEAVNRKKSNVFESQPLNITLPKVESSAIDGINAIIERHNNICDEFTSHVSEAREKLEKHIVSSSLDEYQSLKSEIESQESKINKSEQELERINEEISTLEMQVIEHRQPAEELNNELSEYLGHSEFQLGVKDTGYVITRNGKPAVRLSEGEKTAIALLYFLKSLKDKDFDINKGLVVLDDPVSSLDANSLFLAFGFIRRCVEDAGQLIFLTHNFSMFRQVRNWFENLKNQRKKKIDKRPARFYMLDCSLTDQGRRSRITKLDPLLKLYESEYNYLFACIYRKSQEDTVTDLGGNYIFPNIARRLLEAFLSFRHPENVSLYAKLEKIEFSETIKSRILRFMHTYSHADAVSDPEHDPTILGETTSVLKSLLDLIESEDANHYRAMVRLVDSSNLEERC